ncbi:acyl-CoA dehydrogenase family protein [Variovorax boronicumulans]|uniref:acyl-CoA dehydrogenase family protein n=1 Tax=Variovorax boronicumulans TaxID=436515 RepID=UPI001C56AD5A
MYFTSEPEHITQLRETVRRFAEREMPRESVRQWDRDCTFSMPLFRKLAALGVCGLTIDEAHGGAGRDIVAACAVIEELAQHGVSMAAAFTHCAFYGGLNVGENGSQAQKRDWLPRIARGEMLFAYGLSEPDVGGDLASVTTSARLSEDGQRVILNGTKRWCTGARFADLIVCLVKSDAEAPRYRNLSMVLVSPQLPGVTIRDIDHIGIRYAKTTDVIFDNVEVPVDHIMGGLEGWNQGWKMLAGPALDCEKLEITASALGIATAAVNEAWAYAQERRQFGKPICAHQSVRHSLVEARTRLQACRHMLYHAAWLATEHRPASIESSMAKLFVGDTAVDIVLACQRVMGAYGCAEEYDMERHVRDICVMPIVGGSSNIQKNNIAARMRLPE